MYLIFKPLLIVIEFVTVISFFITLYVIHRTGNTNLVYAAYGLMVIVFIADTGIDALNRIKKKKSE